MTTTAYLRQSLAKDDDELAVSRQLKECKRVAKLRGIQIDQVLTDNNYSASKRGRPAYDTLIGDIQRGRVTQVIILRIDRLLRLNDELEELIALVENEGLKVITCEGEIDLATPQGRLMARILVSVARSEVEVKSARHKLANDQRAESGLPHAGRRAFGFELDGMTVREDEALILKEIGLRYVQGWSTTALAKWLNDAGVRTTMGNTIKAVALRNILGRVRYAGIREHDGKQYPAQWPAIFDADLWQRIQYETKRRREATNKPKARSHLLTGLLFCGTCGAPMNGTTTYDRRTKEPRKSYRCNRLRSTPSGEPGCGKVTRGGIPLEWFIREAICYRLDSDAMKALLKDDQSNVGEWLTKQTALKSRMNSLLEDYTDGTLTKDEYRQAKERVTEQLRQVNALLDQVHDQDSLDALVGAGESIRQRWDTEDNGWKRRLAMLLIERIDVNASRKLPRIIIDDKTYYFDSAAIDVTWRV